MEIILMLTIGISLSMDAFSLSLCYGILNFNEGKKRLIAITIGTFHFIMPLLGMTLGNIIEHYITIDMRYIVFVIFMILGMEMLISAIKKEDKTIQLNGFGILIFAFTVSIDSFSAGIGIKLISNNYLLCSTIFALTSTLFSYVGLILGNMIGSKYKEISRLLGGIVLIAFAINYLLK